MNTNSFLKRFVIFSGILEIFFAVLFCFMNFICDYLGLACLPFFYLFAAVELGILGFLLLYSARDMKRYLVIIVASCIFRYIMSGPTIYTIITVPEFRPMLIGAMTYDILSASLTLILLWKSNYFTKIKLEEKLSNN
ncbi:MAG: hypothetical protein ACFFDW_13630 [Candidatus Thorarchaeota archaeon]